MCAALAVALLVREPASARVRRRIAIVAGSDRPATSGSVGRPTGPGGSATVTSTGRSPSGGGSRLGGRLTRRVARDRTAAVTEACLALSAELGTGVPPTRALAAVAETFPDLLATSAAQAALGGDVPAALRRTAATPGAGALGAVAAAWQVCEHTGASLGDVLARVADSLRADDAVRREAAAQLASVRATTRLLAALPVITLLALSGGGGEPLSFLLGTRVGIACLVVGALLALAGTLWVERMVASATRSSWTPG